MAIITRSAMALLVAGLVVGSLAGAAAATAYLPAAAANTTTASSAAQQKATAGGGGGGTELKPEHSVSSPAASGPADSPPSSQQHFVSNSDLVGLFKKAEGSVVQITSTASVVNNNIIINGSPLQSESKRLGSGFVYDAEGRIVTNNHVVDGAKVVDVTFVDGNTYPAKVLGRDAYSDLAVIQVTGDDDNSNNNSAERFSPLPLGNSSMLQVGEQVVAIGNPFGLSNTMTSRIVS